MEFRGPVACSNISAPIQLSSVSAGISFLLAVITCPANLVICLVVFKDPNKNLRTPFNIFIVSIAAADFMVGSVVLPLSVIFHVCESTGFFFHGLIKALHISVFVSCSASVLAICTLSYDRFVAVTSPLKYRTRLTSKRVKRATAVIWVIAVLMSLIYFKIDFIVYIFVYVNVIVLFTLVVLAFVHCKVSKALKTQKLKPIQKCFNSSRKMKQLTLRRNAKVTKAFFSLLLVFFCCNFPSFILSYVMNFCQTCNCVTIQTLRDMSFLSLMVGSAINPFYYGFRLPHFKTALTKLLPCLSKTSKTEGTINESSLSDIRVIEIQNRKLQSRNLPAGSGHLRFCFHELQVRIAPNHWQDKWRTLASDKLFNLGQLDLKTSECELSV